MAISGGPISGSPISGGGSFAPAEVVTIPQGMIPFRLLLLLPEGEGGLAYEAPVMVSTLVGRWANVITARADTGPITAKASTGPITARAKTTVEI